MSAATRRDLIRTGAGLAAAAAIPGKAGAQAPVRWDISIPWGPSEFHTLNAQRFAAEVRGATSGAVQMTVHPGGALGVRANETVRAVGDGVVPMAEFTAFQNVGDLPILGIESIPFLIANYDELAVMHSLVRPTWERELERRNQTVLYMCPWPTQLFYFKRPIATAADLRGIRMRTYDRVTAEMCTRLGMVPQQLTNPDVVPALASGRIDAVMTSGTTAVAQRYWEFLRHAYVTNHLWATNFMVVNNDAWRRLPQATRTQVQDLAKRLEPEFWNVSKAEHDTRMGELRQNGMTVEEPSPALVQALRQATATMGEEFVRANPAAGPILQQFRQRVGRA
ncbi:TRAP transporter substrate-binding protein [Falsiroseomonas sp. CW058]|uniref:TRAP transporter substrate-binding protein n=1 Tax=Falsiroseomonas sp. CW058 TaxID=3388664 RepID=UPI003D312EAB